MLENLIFKEEKNVRGNEKIAPFLNLTRFRIKLFVSDSL
jgi:hypothetical protein